MDFFSILCTTCKTRLKVRDEGAIGKILACPKCGGMVMVKPPAQWEAGAEADSTRTAIPNSSSGTQPMALVSDPSAFDDLEDLLAGRTPAPKTATTAAPAAPAPTNPTPAAATAAAKAVASPTVAPAAAPVVAPKSTADAKPATPKSPPAEAKPATAKTPPVEATRSAPAPAAASETPIPPAPTHAPEEELLQPNWAAAPRPWRFWLSLSCAGLAGTLLALVVVMVTIRWFQQGPSLAQATPSVVTPTDSNEPVAPVPEPADPPAEPSPAEPTEPTATPETAPSDIVPPAPKPEVALLPAESEPRPAKPEPTKPSLGTLDKVNKLLGHPMPLPEEPEPESKPLPIPIDSDPHPSPAPAALPRPEPRKIDVAARLADKIPQVKTGSEGVPLVDFLQFMLDLSTVPISLDPESLVWVRATPESPVVLSADQTTVGDLLRTALAPLKLEPQVVGEQVLVTLPPKLVAIPFPVGDLTGGDAGQLSMLADQVRELIDPESWKDESGATLTEKKDLLEVKHLPAVQLQVLTLTEKLRVARGLPIRSKFEPAIFRIASRHERARSKLEKQVAFNFSQPTPLVQILKQLGEASNLRILVDWRSLAAEGWTPATVLPVALEKQPLETALVALLKPMDLSVRVIDEGTLQVISARDLAERVELELYPVSDLVESSDAEPLLAKIRTALGDDQFRDGGGKGALGFDLASKHLIAVLPQPQQQPLEKLLREWRAAK